jgi:molybdopterin molybdotransferase
MLTYDDALTRILERVTSTFVESRSLFEARGRVLAEDVTATCDVPDVDCSTMDGYAVRSDFANERGELVVDGESRAGGKLALTLTDGTAMRIFTGAPVPRGADAVVMQEDVERAGDVVRFTKAVSKGAFIRRAASDVARGDVVLREGSVVDAGALAILAGQRVESVRVYAKPRVAILATGDELLATDAGKQRVEDSNSPMIAALVEEAGGSAEVLAVAGDDEQALRAAVETALRCDVVITTGGVSVGDHDRVQAVLRAAGVEIDFWKVAIKPGKPVLFGTKGRVPVLGLPGNPASAFVTFHLFGAPIVRRRAGDAAPLARRVSLALAHDTTHGTGRLEFARATFVEGDAEPRTRLSSHQTSSAVRGLTDAPLLVELPAEQAALPEGTPVVAWIVGSRGRALAKTALAGGKAR